MDLGSLIVYGLTALVGALAHRGGFLDSILGPASSPSPAPAPVPPPLPVPVVAPTWVPSILQHPFVQLLSQVQKHRDEIQQVEDMVNSALGLNRNAAASQPAPQGQQPLVLQQPK